MLRDMLNHRMDSMKSASAEGLLASLGLERRRSSLEMFGSFAIVLATGMVLGAAIALCLAPTSGLALRQAIGTKAQEVKARAVSAYAKPNGKQAAEVPSAVRGVRALEDVSAA